MLHIDDDTLILRPFLPKYYSRNVCPIAWKPDAQCPKFIAFLQSGLDPADVSLIQRLNGSLLLGGNAAQRIFILTPGGGKSTEVEISERIVGLKNVYELRTKHLHERFELSRYIGKSAGERLKRLRAFG
jgi:putative DNA primase/helicase